MAERHEPKGEIFWHVLRELARVTGDIPPNILVDELYKLSPEALSVLHRQLRSAAGARRGARAMGLGLHTLQEQREAMWLAERAFKAAKAETLPVRFVHGYLEAIYDLAEKEGAADLTMEVGRLLDILEAEVR